MYLVRYCACQSRQLDKVLPAADNPRSDDIVGKGDEGEKYPESDVDVGVGAATVVPSTETVGPVPEQVLCHSATFCLKNTV